MVMTRLLPKITKSAHLDTSSCIIQKLSVDEQVKTLLDGGKPVTVWEVVAKSGNGYAEQVSAILEGLTDKGTLARFRLGFNNYYASPKVALTGEEPTPIATMTDSLKNLLLSCRYKASRHLK